MSAVVEAGRDGTRVEADKFRLGRRAHKAVLTAHVLTAVGWFGVALLVAFCGIVGATTGNRVLAAAMFRTVETAVWLSVPLGVLSLAIGAVLSVGTKWGLLRHWWVVAKLVIAFVVVVTDPIVVARAAHDALTTGSAPTPLFGSTIADCVMLTVATVLSVFKPRGRTPLGRAGLRTATGPWR